MLIKRIQFLLLCIASICSPYALAGSIEGGTAKFSPLEVKQFSKAVERYAASEGALAFIIARVGQPEDDLPHGIMFTHTAIAVYSAIELASGDIVRGYAIHNLYQLSDNLNRSMLKTDYPIDFFWSADELKAGIIIPSAELQLRLVNFIEQKRHTELHNPKYSIVSNPFNSQYQNCTEFTLDVINGAIYNTTHVAQLKANATAHFKPQPIHTSRFKLMVGNLFFDGVNTADHQGKVKTATFSTIAKYLTVNKLAQKSVIYRSDQSIEVL